MMVKVAVPEKFKLRIVPNVRTVLFGGQQEIHYIGGSEVLPPPLENEKEREVVRWLGTDRDEKARKILIEHNLRLVVYIAKKFDNTGVGVEDLISIGTIGLIKAINTFNPSKKIKLATYASRCIENEILMYLRRNSKTKMEVSIDEPLNVDWDGNELLLSDILGTEEDTIYRDLEDEAERKILFRALNKLSGREKLIVRMRFGLDHPEGKEMTQKEVADRMKTGPGSKDYGALSLAVQYYAKPELVANVPPNCFMPRPRVGSAVIRLTRHAEVPVQAEDEKLMFQMIRASFNQRRKTLVNGLGNAPELHIPKEMTTEVLDEMGLSASVRGEALTLEQFAELSNRILEKRKNA